jgi:hypothetical protein
VVVVVVVDGGGDDDEHEGRTAEAAKKQSPVLLCIDTPRRCLSWSSACLRVAGLLGGFYRRRYSVVVC